MIFEITNAANVESIRGDYSNLYLVIKDSDDKVIELVPESEFHSPESGLTTALYLVQKAYSLGAKTLVSPSHKALAYEAYRESAKWMQEANNWRGRDNLEEKSALGISREYADISFRFAHGNIPVVIYNKVNKPIGFLVRGEHGHSYSVDIAGTSCNCSAGRNNNKCWHSRSVEIYLKVLHE